ncbi:MAG: metalloregulator ArsR/SmtB family transcription factor [Anaerolineae bacterium]|nr:metalloregulator ArsR/SmtB family transcription factor [Anaerolineae bacterium]
MPGLVEARSPLEIQYVVSLSHSLLATASLVCAAPRFEGLADRLWAVRNQVPVDLLSELCLLITFPGSYQRFTSELIGRLPAGATGMDYPRFRAHLDAMPAIHYQFLALRALARGADDPPAPSQLADLPAQPEAWSAYLQRIESKVAPEIVAGLLADAEQLKQRTITALDRFWHEVYQAEFEATRPLMERSVLYHRAQPQSSAFEDIFLAVTGRLVPNGVGELLPAMTGILFVPSYYVGPYVAYAHAGQEMVLFYNCRSTPAGPWVSDGTSLYPPLKALADETRLQIVALLQGGEMYAQEIVDRLQISQPAVSRHLNLMAAAGILRVRPDGNAKYYSVNGELLLWLADRLRARV